MGISGAHTWLKIALDLNFGSQGPVSPGLPLTEQRSPFPLTL